MKQVKRQELQKWADSDKNFQLVDVREHWEREEHNIGGLHIPMGELMGRIAEIPRDKDVVVYCAKGVRSVIVIQRLEGHGFTNLYNLAGGIGPGYERFISQF